MYEQTVKVIEAWLVAHTFCFFVRHPLQAPLIRDGISMPVTLNERLKVLRMAIEAVGASQTSI